MKKIEAMIFSMTPKERKKPEVLNHRRRQRIANGSGNTLVEVNQFIKQFNQMRDMMKGKGGGMAKMMQQMGGGKGGKGGMPDLSSLLGGAGGMPKLPGGFKLPWK
jgi:signal recognition particle subunit SRP54